VRAAAPAAATQRSRRAAARAKAAEKPSQDD
jgi:hypothetical protein